MKQRPENKAIFKPIYFVWISVSEEAVNHIANKFERVASHHFF